MDGERVRRTAAPSLSPVEPVSVTGGPDAKSSRHGTRRTDELAPRRTKPPENGLREVPCPVYVVQGGNESGFRLQGGNAN